MKAGDTQKRLFAYVSALRGVMSLRQTMNGLMLISETKAENSGKKLTKEEAYEAMLVVADKLRTQNPFTDIDVFFQAYQQMSEEPDWEELLYIGFKYDRMGSVLVPGVLLSKMTDHITEETRTILIAEAEKIVPNLRATVDAYMNCQFTLTTTNTLFARIMERIFAGYKNVTVSNTNIYKYGFLNEQFDLIISSPAFGGRDLTEESANFMCREYDMVALENLMLHIASSGRLAIIMPARITFAGGRVKDLRKFVIQMYKLEEISELPDGIFQNTGIKTYLLVIGDGRTEDVIIRSYEAVGRKTKRDPVEKLELKEETFVMAEELEENDSWAVDRYFAQQHEEFIRFQASNMKKIPLGEVAEIFRGKSVSKKDTNGSIGVVNITNIGQHEIDYESLDKLDEEERKVQKYILQEGDVLLPARGTAIRTAVFHAQSYPCIASSNVIVIRPRPDMLNSTFLKIFIDSPIGNNKISSLQQGMTVMNISYKDLALLEVPFPTINEQREIASEYEEAYQSYVRTISEAEKKWKEVLSKLQSF